MNAPTNYFEQKQRLIVRKRIQTQLDKVQSAVRNLDASLLDHISDMGCDHVAEIGKVLDAKQHLIAAYDLLNSILIDINLL